MIILGNKLAAESFRSTDPEEWLEGATKMDGQFSGGHVKWAPETTEAEVEKYQKATMIPLIRRP